MTKGTLTFKLAKLTIAVSWADGRLDHAEVNALKELLFSLPDLTAREWAELEIYMESPVDAAEREALTEDVLGSIRSAEDKEKVLGTLEALIAVDGSVSDEEQAVFDELKAAVQSARTGLFGLFSRMAGGVLKKRTAADKKALSREREIEDFVRHKILFDFKRQHPDWTEVPESHLGKLCSAAALMGRVAFADEDISAEEKETLRAVLVSEWDLPEPEAELLAEIVERRAAEQLDYYHVTHTFYERTTPEERRRFIACLFQIANASDKTSHDEIEEIRSIANSLKVSHQDFIAAKLTIPREDRSGH